MRFFEGVLFMFVLIYTILISKFSFGKLGMAKYINILLLIIFLAHLIIEGTRWQLYPVYFLVIAYFIIGTLHLIGILGTNMFGNHPLIKLIATIIIVLLILISLVLGLAFPVYKMPAPEGKYKIGTLTFEVTDPNRKAIYSNNENDNRRIKFQIWYPAETTKGYKRVPWLEDGLPVAKGAAKAMGMPEFLFSHTTLVQSNSYKGAPIKKQLEKYPVIVVSHGWTGFRNIHTDVEEMLASNGYVVIGIDHTFGSAGVVFEDGEIDYLNKNALPDQKVPNFLDYGNTLVNTYAGDIELTLNEIEKFEAGEKQSIFKDKLDLDKIGLLGHSTGGGAAVSTALTDKRIKAVMGLDAWVEPLKKDKIQIGMNIPALFLRSEQWSQGTNNNNLFLLLESSKEKPAVYQINGIKHLDFAMVYMYSPLSKYLNITGKLDGWQSASIQHDFELNFFNKYLMYQTNIDFNKVSGKYSGFVNIVN